MCEYKVNIQYRHQINIVNKVNWTNQVKMFDNDWGSSQDAPEVNCTNHCQNLWTKVLLLHWKQLQFWFIIKSLFEVLSDRISLSPQWWMSAFTPVKRLQLPQVVESPKIHINVMGELGFRMSNTNRKIRLTHHLKSSCLDNAVSKRQLIPASHLGCLPV